MTAGSRQMTHILQTSSGTQLVKSTPDQFCLLRATTSLQERRVAHFLQQLFIVERDFHPCTDIQLLTLGVNQHTTASLQLQGYGHQNPSR